MSIVDSQATLCIVLAYGFTSLTSVSIITDFAIPSALFLSIIFLKVKYTKLHFIGIGICCIGISLGFLNVYIHLGDQSAASHPLLGDLLALLGGFCYALENVLQEYFIKKSADVFNILGFLGLYGMLITLVEAYLFDEYRQFQNVNLDDRL